MKLEVKKLTADAMMPTRAHSDDAGMDLYAAEDRVLITGEQRAIKTGIALSIPVGYAGLIWDKSGIALKAGLKTMGGVIDASYRGEVGVLLINLTNEPYRVEKGAKIAQLLIQKIELPEIVEVDELDKTLRGT
ncbi:MAG TPA: dUTP diphosphatase, partial [Patescibacteria group bacterium]|nr:dUTP diphosphatase [Patescibacteria group bacterium]